MKSNSPAFQLYPKDLLSDPNVIRMTNEALGAYVRLLCLCWLEEGLPADPEVLRELALVADLEAWERIWPMVARCFREGPIEVELPKDPEGRTVLVGVPGTLLQPRLERERLVQLDWRRKKSDAGVASGEARRNRGKGRKKEQTRTAFEHRSSTDRTEPNSPVSGPLPPPAKLGGSFVSGGESTPENGPADVPPRSTPRRPRRPKT